MTKILRGKFPINCYNTRFLSIKINIFSNFSLQVSIQSAAEYLVPHITNGRMIHHTQGCECLLHTQLEKGEPGQITLVFIETLKLISYKGNNHWTVV